jgi:hypothetical protein
MDKDGRMKEERCQGNDDRRGVGVFVIDEWTEAESGGGLRVLTTQESKSNRRWKAGKARARERAQ